MTVVACRSARCCRASRPKARSPAPTGPSTPSWWSTIDRIVAKADEHRVATLDEFKLRLEQLAAEQPTVAAARERILERVDDGDLATAEEYMAYARDGEAIPEPDPPPEGIEVFYPAVDVVLAEVDLARAAVGRVAAAGGTLGPLDFGSVQPGDLRVLDAGFRQWRELARVRQISEQVHWESHLPPILQVLGCAANRLVRRAGRRGEHQWVDLEGFSILGGRHR